MLVIFGVVHWILRINSEDQRKCQICEYFRNWLIYCTIDFSQACSYITFALTNLFAPSLIRSYDPKWSVFIGSIFSTIYYTGFQYISSYYFYTSAVLLGIGSAGTSETQTCCIKKLSSYSYIYLKLNDISHSFLIFLI